MSLPQALLGLKALPGSAQPVPVSPAGVSRCHSSVPAVAPWV